MIGRTHHYVSLMKSRGQLVNHVHIDNNMASPTTKVKRQYQIPKQDKHAFSLQYKKDTSKDPSLFTKTRNGNGLLKRGGKVGDPKDRKKAGGSNVGKYSKSEGPFAGPSGGAPAGSYPIGSKARGKSALKLAHNAPNPSGIKAAVYRKYPDLKKKAYRGAKLRLMGMGAMQYQNGTPPKHKGLLRNKKK